MQGAAPEARGLIAVSLSRLVNAGDRVLAFDEEDDVTRVVNEMLDQLRTRAESFRRRRPANIIGLLFHAMTPALQREDNLIVRVEQNIVESLAEEPVDRNALREVAARWTDSSPDGSRA